MSLIVLSFSVLVLTVVAAGCVAVNPNVRAAERTYHQRLANPSSQTSSQRTERAEQEILPLAEGGDLV